MKLATSGLQQFVGGQLEVSNRGEGYLYRGEIASIEVTEGEKLQDVKRDNYGDLKIKLAWNAKMNDDEWQNDQTLDYAASLLIYSSSDIGDGRIHLSGMYTGESVTLFPKGGSTLDRAKVVGLEVSA